jgi:hypothetical protein
MRIRDPGWRQFGSGMEKSRIRDPDKHPGSATLIICMDPDPSINKMSDYLKKVFTLIPSATTRHTVVWICSMLQWLFCNVLDRYCFELIKWCIGSGFGCKIKTYGSDLES